MPKRVANVSSRNQKYIAYFAAEVSTQTDTGNPWSVKRVWREGHAAGGEGGQRWPGTSGRTENQLPGKTRATRSKKYATFFHVCGCVGMGVLVWVAVLEKAFLTQRDNV